MKAISSTFEPVLFIMLCRVKLPFESMDAILMSDQFKWKLLRSTFVRCCLLCCTRWFQLLKLQLLKYLHVNTHTPLHEKHERFPIIKECIPNNLIDFIFNVYLYVVLFRRLKWIFHGWSLSNSLIINIPSLLGALQDFFLKANHWTTWKKHSFVLRPSINALGSYPGGEVPPYNSYKGMLRPTGSYFWDSDLKRSIIIKPFCRTGYNFSNARKLQNIIGDFNSRTGY